MRRIFFQLILVLILLVGIMYGCAANLISREQDIQLGTEASFQVEREGKVLLDPLVSDYVNTLGQKIARVSRWPELTYQIKVLETPEVNAFALPGGYLYVNSGLVLAADNEAELASVIAHEIAHITERHATKQMTKAQFLELLDTFGQAAAASGTIGMGTLTAGRLGQVLLLRKFSRKDEEDADKYGVQYMYQAGYNPRAMITFFNKLMRLEKEQPTLLETLFSTHPPTEDRIKNIREGISDLGNTANLTTDSPWFSQVKNSLRLRMEPRPLAPPFMQPFPHPQPLPGGPLMPPPR